MPSIMPSKLADLGFEIAPKDFKIHMTTEIKKGSTEEVTVQLIFKNYQDLLAWKDNSRAFQARMPISAMAIRQEVG